MITKKTIFFTAVLTFSVTSLFFTTTTSYLFFTGRLALRQEVASQGDYLEQIASAAPARAPAAPRKGAH